MSELKTQIRVGTSGYSYPGAPPRGWYGIFYPKSPRQKFGELEYYSSFFNTVEINTTFYRPPSRSMAAGWVRKTPPGFEFAVKAWQKFTHKKKLGEEMREDKTPWGPLSQADVEIFIKGIGPLADSGKLGILLFQFPPSFRYTKESTERLDGILRAFKSYPKAIELRHRSWTDRGQETRALLNPFGAAWSVIDEPQFASSVGEPVETGSGIFYLRLHGRNRERWWNHREAWERYDYCYSPGQVRSFAQKIQEKARRFPGTKIYVFFNNHARGQAVANGLMLKSEIGEIIGEKVPRAMAEAYPQLAPLVRIEDQKMLF